MLLELNDVSKSFGGVAALTGVSFAGNKVLRFVPPLIVTPAEIDQLIDKLCRVLDRLA